jgi:hypothetical protein
MKRAAILAAVLLAFVVSADDKAKPGTKYTYKGRAVSEQWFEDRYKEFSDKIVTIDGKYFLVWRAMLAPELITAAKPDVGTPGLVTGKVSGITDSTIAVYATTSDGDEVQVRVSGVDVKKYAEDAPFSAVAVFAGMDRNGGHRVREYVAPTKLTKEQFAEALAGGLKLVRYTKVKERRTVAVNAGGFYAGQKTTQMVDVVKETPIP